MNNLKNIAYSLLVIISFSMISASAQASGISIRIGGYGHGYQVAHNSYYPSAYYGYHRPIVTYRDHYKPLYGYQHRSYYRGHGYRNYSPPRHYRSYGH